MDIILQKDEFWKAVSSLAWPIAILAIALIFRATLSSLFKRDKLTIKVAGMELSVAEATEQAGKGLAELQKIVSDLEARLTRATSTESQYVEPLPTGTATQRPDRRPTNEGIAVLWVDDFPSNNAFIIEELERDGIRVRKELSTKAGLRALEEEPFTIVISDLGRIEEGRDNAFAGLDLANAMKSSGKCIPLLIYAGQRALDFRDRLIAAGATDATNSPVDVFDFVRRNSQPSVWP